MIPASLVQPSWDQDSANVSDKHAARAKKGLLFKINNNPCISNFGFFRFCIIKNPEFFLAFPHGSSRISHYTDNGAVLVPVTRCVVLAMALDRSCTNRTAASIRVNVAEQCNHDIIFRPVGLGDSHNTQRFPAVVTNDRRQ